jgi:hypothetical protein
VGQTPPSLAENQTNGIHHSLICTSHTPIPPPNNLAATQHAMNSVSSHPSVQNAKDTVVNGMVSAACHTH